MERILAMEGIIATRQTTKSTRQQKASSPDDRKEIGPEVDPLKKYLKITYDVLMMQCRK